MVSTDLFVYLLFIGSSTQDLHRFNFSTVTNTTRRSHNSRHTNLI